MAATDRKAGTKQSSCQGAIHTWSEDNGECGLKTNQVKRLKELEKENERLRKAVSDLTLEKLILREAASGNVWSARRRRCVDPVMQKYRVSERLACRVLRQHRSTQRKLPRGRADEARLVADMIELARQYGRYGYRRSCQWLRHWSERPLATPCCGMPTGRSTTSASNVYGGGRG